MDRVEELVGRLLEASGAATPGPWVADHDMPYARKPRVEAEGGPLICEVGNAEVERQDHWEADAAWIARCSPDNITALCVALATAQAALRSQDAVREQALEEAAIRAETDADWTAFGKRDIAQWEGGADGARDYRLGIVAGRAIAAAIRALKAPTT